MSTDRPPTPPLDLVEAIRERSHRTYYEPVTSLMGDLDSLFGEIDRLRADLAACRAALAAIQAEGVFADRFDVFAGWVRDVASSVLAGASVAEAVGNADDCAWAEEEIPEDWAEHVVARAALLGTGGEEGA